jgi:hypothetical protein
MVTDLHEGLTLTRCDRCGCRQWCAVEGLALCRRCCPAAVEAAQEDFREERRLRQAAAEEVLWALPPGEDEPVAGHQLVPWRQVAHLFRAWSG